MTSTAAEITERHIKRIYPFDSQDEITEILTDADDFSILMRKFALFNAFAENAMGRRLFDASVFSFVETLPVIRETRKIPISLVGLNSCLFAGYDGDDRQKLALGLFQIAPLLAKLDDRALGIGFFHHPLTCLHPADKVCQNILFDKLDLILCGHLHDPTNAFIQTAAGQAVMIGAGAGFETRESYNSFNLTEIDCQTGQGRVQYFKYLPKFNLWKEDFDINPRQADGCFQFTIERMAQIAASAMGERQDDSSAGPSAPPEPSEPAPSPDRGSGWERSYLKRLCAHCEVLDLSAIDQTSLCDAQGASPLTVSDVFTTLYLKDIERRPAQSVADAVLTRHAHVPGHGKAEKEERLPIQATEAAGSLARLVILGRPGGGKSTLVNHIASRLAKNRLDNKDADSSLPGWPAAKKPLPVRIILRRFAQWLPETPLRGVQGMVWDYIEHQLSEMGCRQFYPLLVRILENDGGVVFFDGLDEVREVDEDKKRTRILEAISDFEAPLDKTSVIVTCREYAYRRDHDGEKQGGWQLPEAKFPVVELDLFRKEQIKSFTSTWYQVTGHWRDWNSDKCIAEANNLCNAILAEPHLRALGRYPLLLTLMAQVHGREGYLPKDRADLYERAVNLLLAHWENRIVRDADGTCRVAPGVIVKLNIKSEVIRRALEHVALTAHQRQEKAQGEGLKCADIPKEDLREALCAGLNNDYNLAEAVIKYIKNRAGLLLARDNRTFVFPHRTFQEYLTATGIMRRGDFETFLRKCVIRDLAWWQEVFLLAAGWSRNTPRNIYDLVDALLPQGPDKADVSADIARYAQLAAQAMGETDFIKHVTSELAIGAGRYTKIHTRIQNWLLTALCADQTLSPKERSQAGRALNWIGDPRFEASNFYLPNDENSGFVEIPAGPFLMGSDKTRDKKAYDEELPQQHTVELSSFYMARYPVTVAQFRSFVKDGAYDAGEKWQADPDNHPVRYVSWEDARAYCRWLTEKLADQNWVITLPTEAQWEKAARGGDGRIYPWGGSADSNRANYDDTKLGTTSPVGCFPGGNSPYGILDMAGNVWEWNHSIWGDSYGTPDFKYPYDPSDGREDESSGSSRVLRGGAFNDTARGCRAAYRVRYWPGDRNHDIGFRLVRLARR
jgi:formylglycine-generating enzyme required for sulfatase activity